MEQYKSGQGQEKKDPEYWSNLKEEQTHFL